MSGTQGEGEWQRRYDESLAQPREPDDPESLTGREAAAIGTSGCLPGWAGAIALSVTGLVLFIQRRK